MAVDTNRILQLRKATGAGMNDCQNALEEAGNDMDSAIEILRKRGAVKAAKKADRETKEGVIDAAISDDKKKGTLIQLLCETDFVARNEDFIRYAHELAVAGIEGKKVDEEYENTKENIVLKIGENITLGESGEIEAEFVSSYIHANKKVGVIVGFTSPIDENNARDIAMHIAAMSPSYVSAEDVPQNVLEKEKEIYKEQLLSEGKPENILEKIVEGKIKKFYEDNCLLLQPFIKDEEITIEKFITNNSDPDSAGSIVSFLRFSI